MLRKLVSILLLLFVGTTMVYGYLVWSNNRDVALPSRTEIDRSLTAGINWLEQNERDILSQNNPMLWWMVRQSLILTGDPRLQKLFDKYESRYVSKRRSSPWSLLFLENAWVPVSYEDISHYLYYNKHFIYALTCDEELGRYPEIAEQNEPGFCDAHLLKPACVTHQLMGLRIMQRNNCGDRATLDETVEVLLERIERQLTWDPRMVDVYLQRVLMLLESDARDLVKPVWLRHILDAQTESGSWTGFESLVPLLSGYDLGFSARGIGVQKPKGNFHVTVQGVFIMSLLSNQPDG